MIPSPIHKVLSTIRTRNVAALLMGGQACVLYGAAEFSRDTDIALLSESDNLARLQAALDDLHAEPIAVPPFDARYLDRGHAIHFRCHHPDADRVRLDVMSIMRGTAPFPDLWARRTTVLMDDGEPLELLSLPDLVRAKKTQRDKDWPMIRRLIEADYRSNWRQPTPPQVEFWLRELRTARFLIDLGIAYQCEVVRLAPERPVLAVVRAGADPDSIEAELLREEQRERELDRAYWRPLMAELEMLRRQAVNDRIAGESPSVPAGEGTIGEARSG